LSRSQPTLPKKVFYYRAKALGLIVPQSLLSRADELID